MVADRLAEVLLEHGVVVVADHEHRDSASHRLELGERGADLVASQRVQRRERSRMEGCHDQLATVVDVLQPSAQHAFMGGLQHAVVQRLLQPERAHRQQAERVLAVVEGQTEAVALGGVRQREPADLVGKRLDVALLQAQDVRLVLGDELREFGRRTMLAQVVRDHLHHRQRYCVRLRSGYRISLSSRCRAVPESARHARRAGRRRGSQPRSA